MQVVGSKFGVTSTREAAESGQFPSPPQIWISTDVRQVLGTPPAHESEDAVTAVLRGWMLWLELLVSASTGDSTGEATLVFKDHQGT